MAEIGIRDLKQQASKILREVREEGASYTVTYQGKPCGIILPYSQGAGKRPKKSKKSKLISLRGILRGAPEVTWDEFMDLKKMWDAHVNSLVEELQETGEVNKQENEQARGA